MNVYEFNFEELNKEKEIEKLENTNILESTINVEVLISKHSQTIHKILKMKENDVILLNKNIDEKLDLCVNKEKIAECEGVLSNNKMAVRIIKA